MRVKVTPIPGTGNVNVVPEKKYGRAYTMATVLLANVTVSDTFVTGELVSEGTDAFPPSDWLVKSLGLTVTGKRGSFSAAYFCGETLYLSEN